MCLVAFVFRVLLDGFLGVDGVAKALGAKPTDLSQCSLIRHDISSSLYESKAYWYQEALSSGGSTLGLRNSPHV